MSEHYLLTCKKQCNRGWARKKYTWLNIIIIWAIKLFFCQNDPPIGKSFWQKNSLITLIFIELCLLWYLTECTFFLLTLYVVLSSKLPFVLTRWNMKSFENLTNICLDYTFWKSIFQNIFVLYKEVSLSYITPSILVE